jgi:hypothetical protein
MSVGILYILPITLLCCIVVVDESGGKWNQNEAFVEEKLSSLSLIVGEKSEIMSQGDIGF